MVRITFWDRNVVTGSTKYVVYPRARLTHQNQDMMVMETATDWFILLVKLYLQFDNNGYQMGDSTVSATSKMSRQSMSRFANIHSDDNQIRNSL